MFTTTTLYKRTVIIPLMVLLLLSLSGGIVTSQPATEGTSSSLAANSAENDYATCAATSDVVVTCTLAGIANQSSLDLTTDLLPLAQQVNGAISADTVMWIQAWGGKGGKGVEADGSWAGGWGGDGGFAQTITTISDYQTTYNTTTLHYYFGAHGEDSASSFLSGLGGASTIVASVANGFAADDVLLIGGGGGGGNYALFGYSGQEGGHGGSAIATSGTAAYGAGQDVKGDGGTARGGSYSGPGQGSPSFNPSGYGSGGNGFGGWGGGVYDDGTYWLNGDPGFNHGDEVTPGSGISSGNSPGSPSGGGYGGGGMNACGGPVDGAHHNCAGAGGGSYAAGITQLDGFAPAQYIADTGASMIKLVFNLQPVTFSFSGPYTGFYNLPPSVSAPASPVFVDIDNDGDQDLFLSIESVPSSPFDTGRVATPVFYLKNHGTATNPQFSTLAQNPFGLQSVANGGTPAFADIDSDGDFDAFIGNGVGTTLYFENTGTSTNPSFASGVVNAFGLSTLGTSANLTAGTAWVAPTFADIDNDGDLDAFIGTDDGHVYYFPNNGSKTSPNFGSAQASAFGISAIGDTYAKPAFFDVEGDGDLDLFIGGGHGSTGFYQNTGTASAPQFLPSADTTPAAVNLFGLTNVGGNAAPTFVDLNGDGTTDALLGSSSGGLWFYPSTAWSNTALAGIDGEPLPVPAYETTPETTIRVSADGQQITATIYGSADFDASHVHRDVLSFEDWHGTRLANVLMAFWASAVGDINSDGYLDRTVIFHGTDPATIQDEIYHGKEFCLRGVTTNGVKYEACNFAEE